MQRLGLGGDLWRVKGREARSRCWALSKLHFTLTPVLLLRALLPLGE